MEEDKKFKSAKAPCLIAGCKRTTHGGSRGMCVSHYAVRQSKVKRGRTTWEELERLGDAGPRMTKESYAERRRKEDPSRIARRQEVIDRKIKYRQQKTCMLPYCNSYIKGGGRGLCSNHYKESAKRVKIGLTTWEQLVIGGVAK
ncbi:MAG: hypothetical protein KAS32_12395 [Candidatus Peribacteraceae bacterium]|nr:hypothetical protein [Candidatus Peribacteraceae bacterium]